MVLRVKRHSQPVSADKFWKPLVDESGTGTKMMWRLADSVFFYMQETRRVWHGIDASQFYWLLCTAAVEPDEVIDNRVTNLARYLDDTGVRYTRVAINGQNVPTLDRTSWFNLMTCEARTAPDYAFQWWTNLVLALPLRDPHHRTPFPHAPPRTCFPVISLQTPSQAQAPLRPGMPHSGPSYVFTPRLDRQLSRDHHQQNRSNGSETSNDHDNSSTKRAKRKLTKPSSWANVFGHHGDKTKLQKKGKQTEAEARRASLPPPAPPIRFVADGRMHKAHEREPDPETQFVRPIVTTQTYPSRAPPAVQSWPDTRGLPLSALQGTTRSDTERRWPDTRDMASMRADLARDALLPDESLVPFAFGGSPATQSSPELISNPAMRAVIQPRGDRMHSVVDRVLAKDNGKFLRPSIPRSHSSEGLITTQSTGHSN